jgi:hypothetical protein
MNEQNIGKNKPSEPGDVEQRLSAYYGPPLPKQPLSPTSWQFVRHRLGVQASTRCKRGLRLRFLRKSTRVAAPTAIQDAFARVASEAGVPSTPTMLRYSLKPHAHEPVVRGSWLGKRIIRLTLPLAAVTTIGQDEFDVLLATGLARSIGVRQANYTLGRLLLAGVVLLACLTLFVCWMHHVLLVGIPLALALCVVVVLCWQWQARSLAFHADTLMVRWLGRRAACRGLHDLAGHSRAPQRRRWGEPSLAERIERVCGTGVEARENQLTLVG